MYFTDKEIEAEVAVVRTLGREPGAVSPSVGKRKQKERDVRRRPGGFLSEAGVRGGGPGRKQGGGGAACFGSDRSGVSLPLLL